MIFDWKGCPSLQRKSCNLSYKITDQNLEASSAPTYPYSSQKVVSDHSVWWLEAFYIQWNYIHSYFLRVWCFLCSIFPFSLYPLLFYRQHFCPLTMIICFRLKQSSLDFEMFFFYSFHIGLFIYSFISLCQVIIF